VFHIGRGIVSQNGPQKFHWNPVPGHPARDNLQEGLEGRSREDGSKMLSQVNE
jgi:hypothetical protein